MNRNIMPLSLLALLGLLGAFALQSPPQARADQESQTLVKYDKDIDASIDKALAYLATKQQKDGSFESPTMPGNTGISSLAVMAFLSKGHLPGMGKYGEVINKGIDYILSCQQADGLLLGANSSHGPMYCHSICTLMLSEVSGMVDKQRQEKIDVVLPKALKLLLVAQQVKKNDPRHEGGWRYQSNNQDADLSCSGWALMALRSARNNGSRVPKEAIDNAIKFIANCRVADGGYTYQPGGGSSITMTGTALLSLELAGLHAQAASTAAGDWILKHLQQSYGEGFFYYGLYYAMQGMFQLGGTYWETYAEHVYTMMIKFQQADGSFPQGSSHEGQAGTVYCTAMGVLAITVSYRQLPIYQR